MTRKNLLSAASAPLPRCHCGAPATGRVRLQGRDLPYCPNHLPPDVVRFQAFALAALLRGTERRRTKRLLRPAKAA